MSVNLFDADFYRAANPELAGLNDAQAFSHFQNSGLDEGRAFSPVANLNFYRSSNPDLAAVGLNTNRQLYDHLQNSGVAEGRRFSQFVDINYYLGVNPDVSRALVGNREQALAHLRGSGVNEGRSFSPFVDLGYYLSTNSDINQAFGGNRTAALEHLEIFGLEEGRQFSPAFDVNFYRNTYPDLTNAGLTTNRSLLEHWVSNGAEFDRRSGTPDPGNSLGTALNLGSPASSITGFNDSVGGSDISDYYSFTLNESRIAIAAISGLSADLDLGLLNSNGNVLQSSSSDGPTADSVTFFGLNPGTYFIQVNQGVPDASSNYRLTVSLLPTTLIGLPV